MELTRDEEQILTFYRQCSPMQRMLVMDALQEMLAIPGEIDLFGEGLRNEVYKVELPVDQNAAGAENMGKILPFRKR